MHKLFNGARAAWPGISLPAVELARLLARRVRAVHGASDLENLNVAALYVSAAAMAGDHVAISLLLTRPLFVVRRRLMRRRLPPDTVDDVLCRLRERLIYPDGARPALLSLYGGRGPLEAWLFRTAYRDALKVVERRQKETPLDDVAAIAHWAAADDPELSLVRDLCATEFRAAITGALEQLGTRERQLLQQTLIEGRSSVEIARRMRVHRVTVNRWLADIRGSILASMEATVGARLRLSPAELRQLALLVGPDLEVSVTRILSNDE